MLNLSKVEFIDGSGLTALGPLLKNLGQREQLVSRGPGPSTANLFRRTRLDKIIKVYADETMALVANPA